MRPGIHDCGRGDNEGEELEGSALLQIEGRVLAFVGLELTTKSATATFDITDPHGASYVTMVTGEGGGGPEGLTAFRVGSRYFVAAVNELSYTTRLLEVSIVKGRSALEKAR